MGGCGLWTAGGVEPRCGTLWVAGLKGQARLPLPPKARVEAGPQPGRKMKSFFWNKLPDNRIDGTFWAAHPPVYSSLNLSEVSFPAC